ncbi:MAG: PDZ domain-containing protein [Paenibacillus sp.]|nr:PDZ domain-containing protein [Paenibacillus sp.]
MYEAKQDHRVDFWKTWIGVQHATTHSNELQPSGSKVLSVKESSPASIAGVRPEDIILKVNSETISSYSDLEATIHKHRIGDQVTLTIWRAGDTLQLPCNIAPYPIPYSA